MPNEDQNSQNTQTGFGGQDTQTPTNPQDVQNLNNPPTNPPQEMPTQVNIPPTPPISVQQESNQPIQNSEPIQQPQETPMPPSGVGKKSGVVFWIAVILFALSMLALIAYFIGAYKEGRVNFGRNATPTPIVTIEPTFTPATPTPDPMADWKIFENQVYGYSIKYPSQWLLLDLTEGKQIEIYYQPDKEKSVGSILIEEMPELNYKAELAAGGYEEAIVGGNKAQCKTDNETKSWCQLMSGDKYISILTVKLEDQGYNNTLDQILSTFDLLVDEVSMTPLATPSPTPSSGFGM